MNAGVEPIIEYALRVLLTTIAQLLILLGPGLILIALTSQLAVSISRSAARTIGERMYLLLFGWLGTSIHETGHAVFNILFRHEIVEFTPFKPTGNEYGHVLFKVNPNSNYQKIGLFFVGIGPILFGTVFIYLAALLLLPADVSSAISLINPTNQPIGSFDGFKLLFDNILRSCVAIVGFLFQPENFSKASFWLFIYLAFAVGSSIRLSTSDVNGARRGFGTLVAALLAFNLATLWMGDFALRGAFLISQSFVFFYALLIFVIILNLFAAILLRILALLLGVR